MRIELTDLRAFLAVSEERSFVRAAERLCTAQPALSRRIAKMEEALGLQLFTRTTRSVVLTVAGEVFATKARVVLDEMERAVAMAGRAAMGELGEIRIGYNDFAIGGPLPAIIQAFKASRPGIWLDLHRVGTDFQVQALQSGRLDVCFAVGPVIADGLNRQIVWRDRYFAVAAENDPIVQVSDVSLFELSQRPHILGDRRRWRAYHERLRALYTVTERFPESVAEGPDTFAVLGLVASGIGVTVYPSCIRNIHLKGIAFRPIRDTKSCIDTVLIWDPDSTNPAARSFVEATLAHCARWAGGFYDMPDDAGSGEIAELIPKRIATRS